MTDITYQQKREQRAERLDNRAAKARQEATERGEYVHKMAEVMNGQPILVGHHSEGRHRRDLDKMHNNMHKSVQLTRQADDLERRAAACRNNTAIFTDDPDASEKLADKVERLQARQDLMKAANRLARKGDRDGLAEMGFASKLIDKLLTPGYGQGYGEHLGFASWELTNNNANIRRLKKRLQDIEAHADDETSTQTIGDIEIIDNVEDNRVQIFFPGKPAPEVRQTLKSNGFRWAPSVGAWQRHRNAWALQIAKEIAS